MKNLKIRIPADVFHQAEKLYLKNYQTITKDTGKLFLFAADHKLEHMNKDFYDKSLHPDVNDPENLFKIAQKGGCGAFATQLGLISKYGKDYNDINYIVKLNSKTNLFCAGDPTSRALWGVNNVMNFKIQSGLKVCGVGYTIYLGSKYESDMLTQAAQIVSEAHQFGLIATLWIYPKGECIKDEYDPEIIAGAAGVGLCLGADFVKVKAPKTIADLKIAVEAAGRTNLICSGGAKEDTKKYLQTLHDQIYLGGAMGTATGRNIFQNSTENAIAISQAIADIVYENKSANWTI
ncbi:MAG: Deoxyribose-phosphate aldolase/phospho-2-dehydro-3-deoxyheptonate aldolase [candidate division TM6 bacterium GW2011_GWF2_32_72]|nr:MAG: Deoxyribose-phosphate aldolase/phospho-2-dehydro-3-deoxyheptonate aldolase [candidate division TM6 bacterium GW2011_GWF2_32_72]